MCITMHALDTASTFVLTWLAGHTALAYLALSVGMFFETLIVTSVFVPGELFLLSGPILASRDILSLPLVALALYGGALLGDSASYALGRILGTHYLERSTTIARSGVYARAVAFFEAHGPASVFFARFLGPVSWVMPALVGACGLPYRTFLPWNALGVFLSVSQFIAIGYVLGFGASALFPYLEQYIVAVALIGMVLYGYIQGRLKNKGKEK